MSITAYPGTTAPNGRQPDPDMRPEPGDVIVVRFEHAPTAYALSVNPHPPQVVYAALENAVACAKRFAERKQVNVWVGDGDQHWTRVAGHRTDGQRRQ